jgi:flagellin-like protein
MLKRLDMRKGISSIIATVLLIAFTVAVAGILSGWLTSFTTTSTQTVKSQSDTELTCSYGGISLNSLRYSGGSSGYLSGNIDNTRTVSLGGLSIQIIFTNKTIQNVKLCSTGTTTVSCATANASLSPRETTTFNITTTSNYDTIRIYTNCSSVYDQVGSGDVSS